MDMSAGIAILAPNPPHAHSNLILSRPPLISSAPLAKQTIKGRRHLVFERNHLFVKIKIFLFSPALIPSTNKFNFVTYPETTI